MFLFDKALSALVCDARFGRDPCVFLLLFLFIIGFWGLFVNFLPRCCVYSRVTHLMWCSGLLFHARRPCQDLWRVLQGVPSCNLTVFDLVRF